MKNRLRYILISLLLLPLGHVPLPYLHDHANLAGNEGQQHLQWYHAQAPNAGGNLGWHFHWLPMDSGSGIPADAVRLATSPATAAVEGSLTSEISELSGKNLLANRSILQLAWSDHRSIPLQSFDYSQQDTFRKICVLRL